MGFLTLDDVNTNNLGVINEFYCLDTRLLGDITYSNTVYDFCKVSKTGNQDSTTTFIFEIRNSLWTGGFYVTDSTGEYIDVSESYSYDTTNKKLTITTSETDLLLYLYLCSIAPSENFLVNQFEWLLKGFDEIKLITDYTTSFYAEVNQLTGEQIEGCYIEIKTEAYSSNYYELPSTIFLTRDYHAMRFENQDGSNSLYIGFFGRKIRENITLDTSSVYLGQNNKVKINYSNNYGVELSGYVIFNSNKYDIYYDSSDYNYYFDLDLRDYTSKHVELELILLETTVVLSDNYSFSFNVDYKSITSQSELLSSISTGGIVNLASDIILTNDIIVTASVKIIGNDNSIDLNGHSIIINEGLDFKAENLRLNNGDTAIIQGRNTKLELDNVIFNNCISSKYNNQGACILCDIDINSLDNPDDYITNLKDCSFFNNHNCIVHGGELTITDCKYLNNDINYSDKNNVAFLYQIDGNANITSSIFDINYMTSDDVETDMYKYCEDQESIGFAQAIVKIGETAIINNYSHTDLINNLFQFNNTCHLFVKYYYPKIESCVYTSPIYGKESNAYCYCASGYNWVFKENVQITRADSGKENWINPIIWED